MDLYSSHLHDPAIPSSSSVSMYLHQYDTSSDVSKVNFQTTAFGNHDGTRPYQYSTTTTTAAAMSATTLSSSSYSSTPHHAPFIQHYQEQQVNSMPMMDQEVEAAHQFTYHQLHPSPSSHASSTLVSCSPSSSYGTESSASSFMMQIGATFTSSSSSTAYSASETSCSSPAPEEPATMYFSGFDSIDSFTPMIPPASGLGSRESSSSARTLSTHSSGASATSASLSAVLNTDSLIAATSNLSLSAPGLTINVPLPSPNLPPAIGSEVVVDDAAVVPSPYYRPSKARRLSLPIRRRTADGSLTRHTLSGDDTFTSLSAGAPIPPAAASSLPYGTRFDFRNNLTSRFHDAQSSSLSSLPTIASPSHLDVNPGVRLRVRTIRSNDDSTMDPLAPPSTASSHSSSIAQPVSASSTRQHHHHHHHHHHLISPLLIPRGDSTTSERANSVSPLPLLVGALSASSSASRHSKKRGADGHRRSCSPDRRPPPQQQQEDASMQQSLVAENVSSISNIFNGAAIIQRRLQQKYRSAPRSAPMTPTAHHLPCTSSSSFSSSSSSSQPLQLLHQQVADFWHRVEEQDE